MPFGNSLTGQSVVYHPPSRPLLRAFLVILSTNKLFRPKEIPIVLSRR